MNGDKEWIFAQLNMYIHVLGEPILHLKGWVLGYLLTGIFLGCRKEFRNDEVVHSELSVQCLICVWVIDYNYWLLFSQFSIQVGGSSSAKVLVGVWFCSAHLFRLCQEWWCSTPVSGWCWDGGGNGVLWGTWSCCAVG